MVTIAIYMVMKHRAVNLKVFKIYLLFCLGRISTDYTSNDFPVDFGLIEWKKMLHIHEYLVKKLNIKMLFRFIKLIFVAILSFGRP